MADDRRTQQGYAVPDQPAPPSGAAASGAPPVVEPVPPEPSNPRQAASVVAPRTAAPAETWSRGFFLTSLKRAFRLHILNEEVLPTERAVLESQASHITDPDQQAFLAWRRSVLFMVACMFVPLTLSRLLESFDNRYSMPLAAHLFRMLPVVADAALCIVMFVQLKNWAQWRKQRRILLVAWGIYFLAPFVVYLYPYRESIESARMVHFGGLSMSVPRAQARLMIGTFIGIQSLLVLGPKIISLMPGLIRASIVSKLLFPGTSAPGWLMMMAAPFYALFVFMIILLPYQITASFWFVGGSLGILAAQIFIARAGRMLTTPLTVTESTARIHRSWLWYIGLMVVSAALMVTGLADVVRKLHFGAWSVVTGVLAVASNILLDTLIGTDAIVTAMAYFRRRGAPDPRDARLVADAEAKLTNFSG